ncbi:phosphoglycolate phosphatase [Gluconobacter thailandicus]|uniref:HAD family hydrolase n=1 Tax=Gluconobacter thailandicus TaxID=257438 RepID=UPI000777B4A8|nr:HAD family hydrolase [Gluconobacter thailandicus]KXV32392.1 phosphoglycolate phosphatase [Gluconobacter thailandicus]
MTRFPIVLLDYDGTLAETQPAILRSLKEAFEASGYEAPSSDALKKQLAKGGTLQTLFQAVVPKSDDEAAGAFVRHYRACYPKADQEETVLFEGVKSVLDTLKGKGATLVILSNKHAPTVHHSIERFGLGEWLSGVIGSEPQYPHKPDPRVMTDRVRPLFPDAKASEFLMVGDTTADLTFARNTGIAGCWASYGHGSAQQCIDLKPDYRIDRVTDLLNVVSR